MSDTGQTNQLESHLTANQRVVLGQQQPIRGWVDLRPSEAGAGQPLYSED